MVYRDSEVWSRKVGVLLSRDVLLVETTLQGSKAELPIICSVHVAEMNVDSTSRDIAYHQGISERSPQDLPKCKTTQCTMACSLRPRKRA